MARMSKYGQNALLFFSVTILMVIAMLIIHYSAGNGKNQFISKQLNVEHVLRHKESQASEILDQILLPEFAENPFLKFWKNEKSFNWQENGLTALLYRNDSLIFWSDNSIPAPGRIERNGLARPILHHGNGWYRVMDKTAGSLKAQVLILIRTDYPYQNQYLINQFHEDFQLDPDAGLDTLKRDLNIFSEDGDFLFSLIPPDTWQTNEGIGLAVFGLAIIAFICMVLVLFYLYHLFDFFRRYPVIMFIAFCADAVVLRLAMIWFEIPGFLYQTALFSPLYYATSFFSPSLGDLVINNILWLALAWLFYRTDLNIPIPKSEILKIAMGLFWMLINALLFFLLIMALKHLVLDSNIELNLNNIFEADLYSGLGFLALSIAVLSCFFASAKLFSLLCKSGMKTGSLFLISTITVILITLLFSQSLDHIAALVFIVIFCLYLLAFIYFSHRKRGFKNMTGALVFIVLFSLTATFILDYYYSEKEKENRKILASKLASRRDPLTEFEFSRIRTDILKDSVLIDLISKDVWAEKIDSLVTGHLQDHYFTRFWVRYELVLTICKKDEILNIQPGDYIANCYDYFNSRITSPFAENVGSGLYFLDDRMTNYNYLGIFKLPYGTKNRTDSLTVFAELFYKYARESGLGYPDLLIDGTAGMTGDKSGYSYAKYINDRLIYKNGEFVYPLGFDVYDIPESNDYFIDNEGYNHYIARSANNNILIISKKNLTLLDLLAPFSYLFILFSLAILLFLGGYTLFKGISQIEFSFSNRLQLAIISIILVSFLVLGMITRANIIHLYNDKNRDNLSEKAFSVLTELEHKIGSEKAITEDLKEYIAEILHKFSMIFYSDINLYDVNGKLIASSRPEIFDEELLSDKMNSLAYFRMTSGQSLLFIQNEKIGRQEYLSAYIPFRNTDDDIIAFVNLPYFAKQTELQKEIGDFLAAYINVYVLLIVVAIMVTILVSRFITRPLQMIREKMARIGLGKSNEKLYLKRRDEIGDLVEEYNRMIDELALSADKLARSERESAWREMAKQVAHEIKNPLTPMKLSVQYLQKAWERKDPDWEKHLHRFTRTIVEQIDTLSEIASEFSDFAKMPAPVMEKIELTGVIRSAAELYFHHQNIRISIRQQKPAYFVKGDDKQLLRAFNNLIQNAVQAIGPGPEGQIDISLSEEGSNYIVAITDNGCGITDEQAKKMFSPSFTTKSSGMGLGLAMVRSILNTMNGSITFESTPGTGTTFTLKIPALPE